MDGNVLLLGEAKWSDRTATVASVDRDIQTLMAKGLPPVQRGDTREARYVLFVSERPKGKPKRSGNVHVLDARDVLDALT
jgi:hypothetical protein